MSSSALWLFCRCTSNISKHTNGQDENDPNKTPGHNAPVIGLVVSAVI